MSDSKLEGSARDRLLAAANELFYAEGIHTVGIDRVIARAGVAKASLYSTFGSKDGLVAAYLAGRHEIRKQRLLACVAKHGSARERILAIFDLLATQCATPSYRGCAFINASSEGRPCDTVRQVSAQSRAWVRDLLTDLARDFGASDPVRLGEQLMLLYDGAMIRASIDRDPSGATIARATAAALLDAAQPGASPAA